MTGPDLSIHLEILRLTFYSFSFLLLWITMTIIITGNCAQKAQGMHYSKSFMCIFTYSTLIRTCEINDVIIPFYNEETEA